MERTRQVGDKSQVLSNLVNRRIALRRGIGAIRMRMDVPVGGRQGRVNGYATQAERYAKQRRLQHLQAELAKVEDRLVSARVSVCRGGRRLAKPDRNRWYLDASWQTKPARPPALEELRRRRALGVDLNADHLACRVLDPSGNPVGVGAARDHRAGSMSCSTP